MGTGTEGNIGDVGNVGNVGNKIFVWATFAAEVQTAMYELRWMIAFATLLILVDLYWGSRDSISIRGEEWHFSTAGRRTGNKILEYMTYMLMGCVGGYAILEPLGICSHVVSAAVGLGFGSLFEVSSIIGHVLSVHGIQTKFNLWKFVLSVLRIQRKGLSEAIEDAVGDDKEDNKKKQ